MANGSQCNIMVPYVWQGETLIK